MIAIVSPSLETSTVIILDSDNNWVASKHFKDTEPMDLALKIKGYLYGFNLRDQFVVIDPSQSWFINAFNGAVVR